MSESNPSATRLTIDRIDEESDKLALHLGRIAFAWNLLHDRLGKLFTVLATPHNERAGWAIWHSLKSDLAQRDMLRALIAELLGETDPLRAQITEALNAINGLQADRNNALHAPYWIVSQDGESKLAPYDVNGNRLATPLSGRNLETELGSYRENILKMWSFTMLLIASATYPPDQRPPLPPTPRLQRVAQAMSRKAASRKSGGKEPRRQR